MKGFESVPPPMTSRGRVCSFALVALALLASGANQAIEPNRISREYPLKALFLLNFGGYVDWPAEALGPQHNEFVIGVLGSAPLEGALQEISAVKRIDGRKIVIRRFPTAKSITTCHILFIARNVSLEEQQRAIHKLAGHSVLIVGEQEGLARHGAAVNFIVEANKIRFEINPDAAREHHLRISAKLLSLAKIVSNR